jgi:acylphosphatase
MEAPAFDLRPITEDAAPAQVCATVHGRVQGVGFRTFTRRHARRLRLSGQVQNEPDGTVTVVAEGPGRALRELVRALHDGPPAARVDDVDWEWGEATGASGGFEITYGRA